MIKILFVCLGNICRSPMAEFIFKDMVKNQGLKDKFYIKSAATSYEEIGNDMHYGAKDKLEHKGIPFQKRKATRLKSSDYEKYDYIIGMDDNNIRNIINIVGTDKDNKVYKLLDFTDNPRSIADPWYTGNFENTYNDLVEGLNGFLNYLKENNIDQNQKEENNENDNEVKFRIV